MAAFFAALEPLFGRLLFAALFLYYGYQKFVATGRTAALIAGRGLPMATLLTYAAGAFELVVGFFIALGLKARGAARFAFVYLIFVSWLIHWTPAMHGSHGELIQLLKNGAIAGGLLFLGSHGPGAASIERG